MIDNIKEIVDNKATIIDPAPAIAKQLKTILTNNDLQTNNDYKKYTFYTSGTTEILEKMLVKIGIKDPDIRKIYPTYTRLNKVNSYPKFFQSPPSLIPHQ